MKGSNLRVTRTGEYELQQERTIHFGDSGRLAAKKCQKLIKAETLNGGERLDV